MPWYIYALLSAFFAGIVAVLGKMGLKGIDSTLATTVRSIVMAVFLIVVTLSIGKSSLVATLTSRSMIFIILSGIAGAISWLFYFQALKQGNVAGVQAVDRMSIVFAILFAFLFLGEAITWKSAVAVLFVLAGGLLMIF